MEIRKAMRKQAKIKLAFDNYIGTKIPQQIQFYHKQLILKMLETFMINF